MKMKLLAASMTLVTTVTFAQTPPLAPIPASAPIVAPLAAPELLEEKVEPRFFGLFLLAKAAIAVAGIAAFVHHVTEKPTPANNTRLLEPVKKNPPVAIKTQPQPATPKPATPKPATPKPATPKPVTPKPVTPKPVTPTPVTPKPVTPKPVTPTPVTPMPVPTTQPSTTQPSTNGGESPSLIQVTLPSSGLTPSPVVNPMQTVDSISIALPNLTPDGGTSTTTVTDLMQNLMQFLESGTPSAVL